MKTRATTVTRGCQSAFALWIGTELPTGHHLIGITRDAGTGRISVACYAGETEIFDDA